ncbi:uncharacterized protein LOC108895645 [Lates calcarifer]|uniref:Uncharacterized protein LOC108895645 n=1 Tax=Lates calcarifer TaxID=8187 RepID=A0AAJ7VEP0_LATCA|nr:uncharacterized protein LOC108895645 [Lates calcarifer]
MEPPMLGRKRPLFFGHENEPPLYTKKCLAGLKTLLDRYQSDSRATQHARLQMSCCHLHTRKASVNAETDNKRLFEQILLWADTQRSAGKVLEHLKLRQATDDIFLNDPVNNKFLAFHHDFTEECGSEVKQHSWAVIEKQEEVIMYGPYYPNYNNGQHSEDIIIKQTQELLESEEVSEDWKVYVFTINSPCLARNTDPCMLNLIQKAQEWWTVYGVKTHIGYVRCWGFKGTKENLFRDIDYSQVDCINQTEDHEDYIKAADKRTGLNPLCKNLSSAVKHLLRSVNLSFSLMTSVQGQDWKSYFEKMHSIFECKPEDEKTVFTQELNATIEAAQALLSERSGSFEEHLESGKAFALDYTFSPQVSDALQDQMRLTFQQCWREMVQDKYAELIREKLTEDFNQRAVQLFIKDIAKFTNKYLEIGRIQFPEEVKKPASC